MQQLLHVSVDVRITVAVDNLAVVSEDGDDRPTPAGSKLAFIAGSGRALRPFVSAARARVFSYSLCCVGCPFCLGGLQEIARNEQTDTGGGIAPTRSSRANMN